MNFRTISAFLAGLLILSLGLNYFQYRETLSNSEAVNSDRRALIEAAEKAKEKADSTISEERELRTQEQAQHEREQQEYRKGRSENTVALQGLKQARKDSGEAVSPITQQIEAKYEQQRIADSLEIVRLEKKIFSDSSSFEREITATNEKYLAQVVISDQHFQEVQELKAVIRKEKTRKTGWKILAIVTAGLFVYESVKD